MKLNPNYYDTSLIYGKPGCEMKDTSGNIGAVTDVPYTRYCVDCGRCLERKEDRKHVKCICGCEFCFACLKKTERGGSAKELRCRLDDTCTVAPWQTENPHPLFKKSKYRLESPPHGHEESAPSRSSDPEPEPEPEEPTFFELLRGQTRGLFEGWCRIL